MGGILAAFNKENSFTSLCHNILLGEKLLDLCQSQKIMEFLQQPPLNPPPQEMKRWEGRNKNKFLACKSDLIEEVPIKIFVVPPPIHSAR
ncbi:hypothetical protein CDAR_543751 [Caerostris darwini]|uniref:Uncharacterized protein n=1 Tax=Caerostris darwini TaxID=1538125 RepID=A0AAV4NLM9_9ARAC|nr:hypothetical protein CDAR_543751 [Caerostris darwini]